MSKSQDTPSSTSDNLEGILFEGLPQEVLDVADRIGLKRSLPNGTTEAFLKNRMRNRDIDSELKYAKYIFNEPFEIKSNDRKIPQKLKTKLSAGQRKRIFKINDGCVKYSVFLEINKVWCEYMNSVLEESKTDSSQINFLRADYHGALFVVAAAKNPALIGIKGFVVQETKNTFKLVSSNNKLSSKLMLLIFSSLILYYSNSCCQEWYHICVQAQR